jgi:hypothetical protein
MRSSARKRSWEDQDWYLTCPLFTAPLTCPLFTRACPLFTAPERTNSRFQETTLRDLVSQLADCATDKERIGVEKALAQVARDLLTYR